MSPVAIPPAAPALTAAATVPDGSQVGSAAGRQAVGPAAAARGRSPRPRTIVDAPAFRLLSPLALLLLWAWASATGRFPETLLPSPAGVLAAAHEVWLSGELAMHLSASLQRLAAGFVIGGLSGIVFGVLLGVSRTAERFLSPTFQLLRQLPTVALIPMFILIFGIGESFKVAIVLKACFFILGLAAYDAVRLLPVAHLEVARLYRLPAWTLFRRVLLPATLPSILTGARLALSRSWLVLVGAELLAAESGIGQMMEMSRQIFRMDLVLVGVLVTGLIGYALDRGFLLIERRAMRWKRR